MLIFNFLCLIFVEECKEWFKHIFHASDVCECGVNVSYPVSSENNELEVVYPRTAKRWTNKKKIARIFIAKIVCSAVVPIHQCLENCLNDHSANISIQLYNTFSPIKILWSLNIYRPYRNEYVCWMLYRDLSFKKV